MNATVRSTLLALCLLATLVPAALAEPTAALSASVPAGPPMARRALVERAVPLRGQEASAAIAFTLAEPVTRQRPARLLLQWDVSGLVTRAHSTLGLRIDGNPLRHVRLSSLADADGRQRWVVPLHGLAAGDHLLEVSARLSVDEDPCLERHADAAWLTLADSSSLFVPEAARAPTRTGMAELPEVWRRLARPVTVDVDGELSPELAEAVLEASSLLRSWGVDVVAGPASGRATSALFLRELSQLEPGGARERLVETPEAGAMAWVDGEQLWVVGREQGDLARAIRLLATERVRQLCGEPCFLSDSVPFVEPRALEARDPHDPQVLRLSDLGYSRGWVAQGMGPHQLKVVWTRPAWWTVAEPPLLELLYRMPQAGTLHPERSTLHVALNDVPLATWRLEGEQARDGVMRVRVPEAFFDDAAWVFDIQVELRPAHEEACQRVNQAGLWLTLGPDSGLHVERDEDLYVGLASYFDQARSQRPKLLWHDGTRLADLVALGAVLFPLEALTPRARWDFVGERGDAAGLFVDVAPVRAHDPLRRVPEPSARFWLDSSRKLGIPLVSLEGTVRVSHIVDGERQVLRVEPGRRASSLPVAAPDLAAMVGEHGLWNGERWHVLGASTKVAAKTVVRAKAPTPGAGRERLVSDSETKMWLANTLWGGLGLLVLAFALWWTRRAPTPSARAGLAIEENADEH